MITDSGILAPGGSPREGSVPWLAAAAVALFAFLLYLLTLAPTVIWGDSASFAIYVSDLNLGFGADAHPLHILLGRLFSLLPFEPAYSLNLLSAVTAALAVASAFLVIVELTGSAAAGAVGASALAFSHAFWLHAVIAEVYDLNAFFALAVILILLRWRRRPENPNLLYLAAFAFGLGMTNHLILGLEIGGFVFLAVASHPRILTKPKALLFTLLSFCAGSSLLIFTAFRKFLVRAIAVDKVIGSRTAEVVLVPSWRVLRDIGMYAAYLFYQFPLLGFLLGLAGIVFLLRKDRRAALALILCLGVNMLFFVSFGPGARRTTKYTFYIPDYAIFAVFIGCGFSAVQERLRQRGFPGSRIFAVCLAAVILLPVALYKVTPRAARAAGINLIHARTVPYRDNGEFFLYPPKNGYDGAARYAREALGKAAPGAVIIADYTPRSVLLYAQREWGMRPDVLLLPSGKVSEEIPWKTVRQFYGRRAIYLADNEIFYNLRKLKEEYELVPDGVLYRVVRRREAGAA